MSELGISTQHMCAMTKLDLRHGCTENCERLREQAAAQGCQGARGSGDRQQKNVVGRGGPPHFRIVSLP